MASENEKKRHRCCFTGHRPEKLIWQEEEVCIALDKAIQSAIEEGFSVFISGMARGVDIWAAETVLRLRESKNNLRLICASPYHGFEQRWSRDWQKRYATVLQSADLVRFVCKGYSSSCFQVRNEWMVNHSAKVIAVWNGQPSGTKNTIDYARKNNVPVNIISLPDSSINPS